MVLEIAPGRMIKQLERQLGLSADELARALGVSPRTL